MNEPTAVPGMSEEELVRYAARLFARRGGRKGGIARSKALSRRRRVEIAALGGSVRQAKRRYDAGAATSEDLDLLKSKGHIAL